jgi:hypothetical protein
MTLNANIKLDHPGYKVTISPEFEWVTCEF